MIDKPLWMPTGSVRSIIAIVVILATIFNPECESIAKLAVLVVGFYFGSRTQTQNEEKS